MDDAEVGVLEVRGEPVGIDQSTGIGRAACVAGRALGGRCLGARTHGSPRQACMLAMLAAPFSRRYPPLVTDRRWRTLVLLYPVLDARYGSGLSRKRAQRVMGRDERETMEAFLPRIPAAIEAWSDGLAALEPFDLIVVRRPLKSLSASGGGRWWVGPREVGPELADVAASGTRTTRVYAMWPADPSDPAMRMGLQPGSIRCDVRGGVLVDLDRWLADARHGSRSGAGLRP